MQLTRAELEIMFGVWVLNLPNDRHIHLGVTIREIHDQLYPQNEKAVTTVQTVMERLVEKAFLKKEMVGGVNFYKAIMTREMILHQELRRFTSLWFNGSLVLMMQTIKAIEQKDKNTPLKGG